MKKVFLKSISVFLCIVCILGAVPLCASAAEVYAPVVSKDYEGLDYVDLTWNDTYPVDNYNVYFNIYAKQILFLFKNRLNNFV